MTDKTEKEFMYGDVPEFKRGMLTKLAKDNNMSKQRVLGQVRKLGWQLGVLNGKQVIHSPHNHIVLDESVDWFKE